jgi:tetratricopeptide (TPR) repeat protein
VNPIRAVALPCAVALALLCGCGYQYRFDQAVEDERNRRWEQAYQRWHALVEYGEAHHFADGELAALHYNFGRAAGATCRFDEAERELLQAAELDVRSNGPIYKTYAELSSLNFDQKKYAASIGYAKKSLAATDPENVTPWSLAVFLDEYAVALDETGNATEAADARQRALTIRQQHPGSKPIWVVTARAPYGTQCPEVTQP